MSRQFFILMCTNKKLEYLELRVNIAKCVHAICQCVTATTMKQQSEGVQPARCLLLHCGKLCRRVCFNFITFVLFFAFF